MAITPFLSTKPNAINPEKYIQSVSFLLSLHIPPTAPQPLGQIQFARTSADTGQEGSPSAELAAGGACLFLGFTFRCLLRIGLCQPLRTHAFQFHRVLLHRGQPGFSVLVQLARPASIALRWRRRRGSLTIMVGSFVSVPPR